MAKDLSNATGIGTDVNFLNGNIVDGQTKIGEHVNQDMVQTFQKLMDDAGLVANGNFDNEVNFYQLVDALVSKIRENTLIDRGATTANDFNIGDLVLNGSNQLLDLSSIIPADAKHALLSVRMSSTLVAGDRGQLSLYRAGGSGDFSLSIIYARCVVAGEQDLNMSQFYVPLNAAREINYEGSEVAGGLNTASVTVVGWIF